MYHKRTDQLRVKDVTRVAEAEPRITLPAGRLFAHEAYVLKVLEGQGIEPTWCEFRALGMAKQEVQEGVRLGLRRATGEVTVLFSSLEFGDAKHWAATLLPPVPFEVRHQASGAVAYASEGVHGNRVPLPAEGTSSSARRTRCTCALPSCCGGRHVVRRARRAAGGRARARARGGLGAGVAAIGRCAAAPRGDPVRAAARGDPHETVAKGRTLFSAVEVPCDVWYVDQGALYIGERYCLVVPKGNGFDATSAEFEVSEAQTIVQLQLARQLATAEVHVHNAKAGTGHWSEWLPLPRELLLTARLQGEDERKFVQVAPEAGSRRFTVALPLSPSCSPTTYVVEVQPINETLLRSSAPLSVGAPSAPGSVELPVERVAAGGRRGDRRRGRPAAARGSACARATPG